MRSSFFLLILTFLLLTETSSSKVVSKLYDEKDPIVLLDVSNFEDQIYNSPNAWLVEFYSSWCGHCIRYASTYKEIANDVKAWSHVLNIAAIDCSAEENLKVCTNHEVNAYPTLKLFQANSKLNTSGKNIEERSPRHLIQLVIDYLTKHPNRPSHWPNFSPLVSDEPSEVWDELQDSDKCVVLAFEDDRSYLGRQLSLEFSRYLHKFQVRRVMANQKLRYRFRVTEVPSVYVLLKNNTVFGVPSASKRISLDEIRIKYTHAIRELLSSMGIISNEEKLAHENDRRDLHKEQRQAQARVPISHLDEHLVHMKDLESTLHYAFRHEVSNHAVIKADVFDALLRFIQVLVKDFPAREPVQKWLKYVGEELSTYNANDGGITSEQWLKIVDHNRPESFLPKSVEWDTCLGSEPKYRGYPCGLWTLFHSMIVNAVVEEEKREHPFENYQPSECIYAVVDYIKYFFSCKECRNHFAMMVAKVKMETFRPNEPILWLWQAHNEVNMRLAADETEDPKHPKERFPTKVICPKCYLPDKGSALKDHETHWDMQEVLVFLKAFYAGDHFRRDGLKTPKFVDDVDVSQSEVADSEWVAAKQADADKNAHKAERNEERKEEEEEEQKQVKFGNKFKRDEVEDMVIGNRVITNTDVKVSFLLYCVVAVVFVGVLRWLRNRRWKDKRHIV